MAGIGKVESHVELFISCRDLKDADLVTLSDPLVEVEERVNSGQWRRIGRTERVDNNLNPDFTTTFKIIYNFEQMTMLRFKVFDIDSEDNDTSKADFLGTAETNLHEIAGMRGKTLSKDLTLNNGSKKGKILLRFEEISEGNDKFFFKFSARDLTKVTCFLCPLQPFLEIARIMEDGSSQVVWRSQVGSGTNPTWNQDGVTLQKLCNNDRFRPLRVEVLHYNSNSNNVSIGIAETTVNHLLSDNPEESKISLRHPSKKGSQVEGTLTISSAYVKPVYTFLDYISKGCEINMVTAVDFTASNGNPSHSTSLHHITRYNNNEYQRALTAVGEIVLHYDNDKFVPFYGFGGTYHGSVSHAFPLNDNPGTPEVYGMDGLFETYQRAINSYPLCGPTFFAPVINKAVTMASEMKENHENSYVILLILTDGVIHDMAQTTDLIVRGSNLPLSIIIVGVGQADFSMMEELDADDIPLRDNNGRKMKRDIVQFVPFRQCSSNVDLLRREVLAEVPGQVTEYFEMVGMKPGGWQ